MRRFLRLPSGVRFVWFVATLYFVLRGASSYGRPAARFPDTLGYESLVFHGANDRFWPVPLAFRFAQTMGARVFLHVVIGTVAWAWLAIVLSRSSRFPRAVMSIVLITGLVPQVVRWDLAILSESIGISLAVAAVAATVWAARSPSMTSRLSWFAVVIPCAMVRPGHLVVLAVCTVGALTIVATSRGRRMVAASLILVAASTWGWSLLAGNRPTSELNLYTVLAERVVTNDATYAWFVSHGMPDIPGMRTAEGYDFTGDLPPDLATFVNLPEGQQPPALVRAGGLELATWIRAHGWRTFARWTITHPSENWSRIASLASTTLDPPNDDFLPLEPRTLVPRALFRGWWLWIIAGVAALAVGFARPGGSRSARALVAMAFTTAAVWALALLASGIEHQRHAATVAVVVRVIALAALANVTTSMIGAADPVRARREDPRD